MMNGWVKVKEAARYAGISERTLEDWLKNGLRYAQLPSGLRLIKLSWIDEYLENFVRTQNKTDEIVNEVFSKLN